MTAATDGMSLGSAADAAAYVEEYFRRARGEEDFVITTATDLDVSPDGLRIAFTAVVQVADEPDPVRHVAVLDTGTSAIARFGRGSRPRWDPSGRLLAWPADDHVVIRAAGEAASDTPPARIPCAGAPEYVAWRPDGRALLVGVAEPGAELSDADGSGTIPDGGGRAPGVPAVEAGPPASPGRALWVADPVSGVGEQVSPSGLTVWQAAWAGSASIVCVVSEGPTESSWYDADLALLDPATRTLRPLPRDGGGRDDGQVALPAANPSGTHVSAVAGTMSDRGVYAGRLVLVDPVDGRRRAVDTVGVDVTSQGWDGEAGIVFAGLRGLDTVIGRYRVDTETAEELAVLPGTCGSYLPEIAVAAGIVACTAHRYGVAPALSVLTPGGAVRELRSFAHAGTAHLAATGGGIERVAWESADGVEIEGLLVTPPGPGPHPLVVNIHGGPVWAWRDEWSAHYVHTPLLVSCGYAVLLPNMRGSVGRGQGFVRDGLLDMGGADALDFTSGLDMLIAAGRVDPARIAVTGNSYGGFMAAWLVATSDRFAAAIACSPVTDWVSQHYTSNISGFDRMCLTGHPMDPESSYRTRSPFYLADRVRSPVLLTAGAKDLATPPEEASMFHRALVENGTESTLAIYPDEGHGVRGRAALINQCVRMVGFLAEHLARTR